MSAKISSLPIVISANIVDTDILPIVVGVATNTAITKRVSVTELRLKLGTNPPSGGRTVTSAATYLANNAVFNVKDFGAFGDGVTDDTVFFAAATTAMLAAGGGTMYVPDGTYMINPDYAAGGSIYLPSFSELRLSAHAILKAIPVVTSSYAIVYLNSVTDARVFGGTIQGERTGHLGAGGQAAFGIKVMSSTRVWITNVYVKDCWADGIYIGSVTGLLGDECVDVTIVGVVCDNNRRQGMSVVAGKRVHISHSSFLNTNGQAPEGGVDFEPNAGGAVVQDCSIVACTFQGNKKGVIYASTSQQILVTASTFRDHATWAAEMGSTAVDPIFSNNIVIQSAAASYGIYLHDGVGCLVTGNTIRGTMLGGINVGSSGAGPTVGQHGIINNKIIGDGVTANSNGIISFTGAENVRIIGNEIWNWAKDGIQYSSNWMVITDNDIHDNINSGIHGTGDNCIISKNTCRSNTFIGIQIGGTNFSTISENTVFKNGQEGISCGSTNDSIISRNVINTNSQTTDNTKDGLTVTGNRNLVLANTIRIGALANRQRFAINMNAAGTGNIVDSNDTQTGGATGEMSIGAGSSAVRGERSAGQVSVDRGDAAVVLARGDAEFQRFNTALTANRIINLPVLSASASYPGMPYTIFHLAGGAFTLDVKTSTGTLIKSIPATSYGSFKVNDANNAWLEVGFGAL